VILAYHKQMMRLSDKGKLTAATMKDVFEMQADMNAAVLRVARGRQGPASQPETPAE
jgi:hypothetical protein